MRRSISSLFGVIILTVCFSAGAAEGPVEKFAAKNIDRFETGCQTELETYCQTVTPGEGRGVACIYAHNDKLSRKCEDALYDSTEEFQNAVQNLNTFTSACQADMEKLCSTVAIGDGRILACLEKNKQKVSSKCNEARKNFSGDLGKPKAVA